MSAPFIKPPNQQQILANLSAQSHMPINDVAALYELECASLAAGAHITTFLHIFAIRNVREILRMRAVDRPKRSLADCAESAFQAESSDKGRGSELLASP